LITINEHEITPFSLNLPIDQWRWRVILWLLLLASWGKVMLICLYIMKQTSRLERCSCYSRITDIAVIITLQISNFITTWMLWVCMLSKRSVFGIAAGIEVMLLLDDTPSGLQWWDITGLLNFSFFAGTSPGDMNATLTCSTLTILGIDGDFLVHC